MDFMPKLNSISDKIHNIFYMKIVFILFYSIVCDALFPLGTSPKGMATAEEPPPLPIHTLPPCLFNPSPSINNSFMNKCTPSSYPSILQLALLTS